MTGKVLVKVDREVDPYQHIDRVREEVYEHVGRLESLENEVQALKNVHVKRWTDTGIWDVVKSRSNEQKIDWLLWGVRAALGGLGASALVGIGFVIKMAYKGLTT